MAISVLTVNTGSSSVKLAAFSLEGNEPIALASVHYTLADGEPEMLLQKFLQAGWGADVGLVAHRVVHGGARFTAPALLDEQVEREIERLILLAPLHNPTALKWIRAAREVLGAGVPQVAVFDTAFFTGLPAVAQTYAIPHDLAKKHGLRRFGFHGLAHQAMWRRWCKLRTESRGGGKAISFQLGAGCSITAIEDGKPRDTSMGFSPLEGLMMATRSGDIDTGLVTFLQRREGLTPDETDHLLNKTSGLLGVSGISADMRQLLLSQDNHARLAVDLYCYRARKYLGAYLAVLGGTDAIIFGGGVGENAPAVRARILENMAWAGIEIDPQANLAAVGVERCISRPHSRVEVWTIPVDEATVLAQEALVTAAEAFTGDVTQ